MLEWPDTLFNHPDRHGAGKRMGSWTTFFRAFTISAAIASGCGLVSRGQAQDAATPCVDPTQFARSVASITWFYDQTRTERDGNKIIGERATGWFFGSQRWLVTAAHFARDLPTDVWQDVELRQATGDGSEHRTVPAQVRVIRNFEPPGSARREQTSAGDIAVLEFRGEVPEVRPLEIRTEPPSPDEHVLVLAYPAGDLRVTRGVVRNAEAPAGRFAGLSLLEVEGSNRLILNSGASGAPVLDCHQGRVTAVVTGLLTGAALPFLPRGTVIPTPWGSPTNAAVPAHALAAMQDPRPQPSPN